jgi:energy-coupling factor transporter ATP-binding protein EcfA2
MHIDRVTVNSFGAIKDKSLKLSPGLTVVVGHNGAGKSTWHAALYAALCGHRQTTAQFDRDFEDFWAPEDDPEWSVSCELTFDDGRLVEVHQDLRHQRSTVTELSSGATSHQENRTAEMVREIGLDRYSYAATAWIDHEASRVGTPDSLWQSVSMYVKDQEVQAALAWLGAARQRLGLAGSNGRRAQAQQDYDRLLEEAKRRAELRRRYEEETRALEIARENAAAASRQWRLAQAAVSRAAVRQIEGARSRIWPFQTGLIHLDMNGNGTQQNVDTDVHWTVAAAVRELEEAEAALETPEAKVAVEQPTGVPPSYVEDQGKSGGYAVLSPIVVVFGSLSMAAVLGIASTFLPPLGRAVALSLAVVIAAGAIVQHRLRRKPATPVESPPERPVAEQDFVVLTQNREVAMRRVMQASDQLMSALKARGVQAEDNESVRQLLDRYRAECTGRADAEGNEQTELADLHDRLELAREEARLAAEGFHDYEIPEAGDVDVHALHSQREAANIRVVASEQAVAAIASQFAEIDGVADLEEALRVAKDKLSRLQLLDETLLTTLDYLARARRYAFRPIAEGVEWRLWEHMVSIVGSQNITVEVDPKDMCVTVSEAGRRGRRNGHRSDSTDKLSKVFARISLGQHLGGQDEEKGPLLLDDIVSHGDDGRMVRALNRLLPISDQRQVVIFAQQEAVAVWARETRRSKPHVNLIRLTGICGDPEGDPE